MSNQAICFQQPLAPIVNGSTGAPYASGTVGLYTVGTLTPLAVFSDIGLSVTLTNPVPINASGYTRTRPIGTAPPGEHARARHLEHALGERGEDAGQARDP